LATNKGSNSTFSSMRDYLDTKRPGCCNSAVIRRLPGAPLEGDLLNLMSKFCYPDYGGAGLFHFAVSGLSSSKLTPDMLSAKPGGSLSGFPRRPGRQPGSGDPTTRYTAPPSVAVLTTGVGSFTPGNTTREFALGSRQEPDICPPAGVVHVIGHA
jgi:hypothetical protein